MVGFCGKEFGFLQSDNVVFIEAEQEYFTSHSVRRSNYFVEF